jgi:hypothetical protein
MKTLPMPAPLPRLMRPPVAFRLTQLVLGARARLARRPLPVFAPEDFDFSDLAVDAPNWLAQLAERNA